MTTAQSAEADLLAVDVGLVSADRNLVTFFAQVLDLVEISPLETSIGTIYRLQLKGGVMKVLVPLSPPESGQRADPFFSATGLRYLTFRVRELDPVVTRAVVRGARIRGPKREIRPGVFLVTAEDPDGNMFEVIEDHTVSEPLR